MQQQQPVTISNQPPEHTALDFNALRDEGIGHLQRLAGKTWTDHNTHDPGITILDQFCYALTDLSYRINFDTKDLLARPNDTYKSLYSPATVLGTNPVTLNDFRKVLLDITGVKNAWIEKIERSNPEIYFDPKDKTLSLKDRETLAADVPVPTRELISIRGLYRVVIAKADPENTSTMDLTQRIWLCLQDCRNLCEDFEELVILGEEPITVSGTVEVGNTNDANMLAASILYRLANWLSPAITFYTLQQMQAKGMRIDEIIDGPALQHGFIHDEELAKFKRLNKIYASDLIREIMVEPLVRVVTDLGVKSNITAKNSWVLPLNSGRVPMLNAAASLEKNGLVFKKNGRELVINTDLALSYFHDMQKLAVAPLPAPYELDIIPEKREPRDISNYFSIQHHFPQVYGIGTTGLPDSAPDLRKAQAKQLKAYLLFFEQLLANYFKQTGHIKDLFSFDSVDAARTYFSQSLIGIVPEVKELLTADYNSESLAGMAENEELALDRKNRFLDHLLTRFSEDLVDYSLWLNNQQLLKPGPDEYDIVKALEREKERRVANKTTLMNAKLNFLQNYPLLGAQRAKGFDHTTEGWGNENVSGLEKRIAAKLGIPNYKRKRLGEQEDGFHMVEHILLRPGKFDKAAIDAYTAIRYITGLSVNKDGATICECSDHGLQNGDFILISEKGKETPYEVFMVFEHNFRITANFDTNNVPLSWVRRDFNSIIFKFDKGTIVKDPYSFQLTFVFPYDNKRLADPNFREFIETTIREETPAHLTVYIQWLDQEELRRFENAYWLFLNQLAAN